MANDRLDRSGIGLSIREADPSELVYIRETTCKVRWPKDRFTWPQWRKLYEPKVTETISSGSCEVAGAEFEGIPILLGFALFDEAGSLDMLAVKRPFVGNGIGLRLLETHGITDVRITLPTPQWERWTKYHGIKWRQNG